MTKQSRHVFLSVSHINANIALSRARLNTCTPYLTCIIPICLTQTDSISLSIYLLCKESSLGLLSSSWLVVLTKDKASAIKHRRNDPRSFFFFWACHVPPIKFQRFILLTVKFLCPPPRRRRRRGSLERLGIVNWMHKLKKIPWVGSLLVVFLCKTSVFLKNCFSKLFWNIFQMIFGSCTKKGKHSIQEMMIA